MTREHYAQTAKNDENIRKMSPLRAQNCGNFKKILKKSPRQCKCAVFQTLPKELIRANYTSFYILVKCCPMAKKAIFWYKKCTLL